MTTHLDHLLRPVTENHAIAALGTGFLVSLWVRRREPSPWGAVISFWLSIGVTYYGLIQANQLEPAKHTAKLAGLFLAALYGNMILYRISPWHPLAKFPGPFLARITQMWWFRQHFDFRCRFVLEDLHKRYGKVVRIGPNELSFVTVEGIKTCFGAKDGWIKGSTYVGSHDALNPKDASLPRLRSHAAHAFRRRIWDQAFTQPQLQLYARYVMRRTREYMDTIKRFDGKSFDFHAITSFFTYDVMNDLAFAGETTTVADGYDRNEVIDGIRLATRMTTLGDGMPWLRKMLTQVTPAFGEMARIQAFVGKQLQRRIDKGSDKSNKDVFHFLLEEDGETQRKMNKAQLANDAYVVVIAGADTTSQAMSMSLYFMLSQPKYLKDLQIELDKVFATKQVNMNDLTKNAPLLNAIIDETLRLNSALMSGMPRLCPKGGRVIEDIFIPQDTNVRIPLFLLHRDERFYGPDAKKFRPERWIHPKEESVFNTEAYMPFSVGPYGCVGKSIALQELRFALAALVMTFDLSFAPGFNPNGFPEAVIDAHFSEIVKPLNIVAKERSGVVYDFPQGE